MNLDYASFRSFAGLKEDKKTEEINVMNSCRSLKTKPTTGVQINHIGESNFQFLKDTQRSDTHSLSYFYRWKITLMNDLKHVDSAIWKPED